VEYRPLVEESIVYIFKRLVPQRVTWIAAVFARHKMHALGILPICRDYQSQFLRNDIPIFWTVNRA
jgi:hypothetical protein